jgi:short-chain Z-isoprenyl diphosphate synthase
MKVLDKLYLHRLRAQVASGPIPAHVAMVMDGNRRWAREAGITDVREGHRRGFTHVAEVLRWCARLRIDNVTLFWISVDNLAKRDPEEAANLMRVVEEITPALASTRQWRIEIVGRVDLLPARTATVLKKAREDTRDCGLRCLTLAVGYDGREDITDAVRALLEDEMLNGRSLREAAERVSVDSIAAHFSTSDLPAPDLMIRTSGEQRLSGFLQWQASGASLCFVEAKWPGLREIDLLRAIRTYTASRKLDPRANSH